VIDGRSFIEVIVECQEMSTAIRLPPAQSALNFPLVVGGELVPADDLYGGPNGTQVTAQRADRGKKSLFHLRKPLPHGRNLALHCLHLCLQPSRSCAIVAPFARMPLPAACPV
jgi:hypothetical protein